MVKPNSTAVFVFLSLFVCAGCVKKEETEILARVENMIITKNELQRRVKEYDFDTSSEPLPTKRAFRQEILNELIEEKVFLLEAKRQNIKVTNEELETQIQRIKSDYNQTDFEKLLVSKSLSFSTWSKQLRNSILIQKVISKITEDVKSPSEQEIQKYYDNNKESFKQGLSYKLQQIVVKTETEAKDIQKRLRENEDFSQLAKAKSISPEKRNGGYLGIIPFDAIPSEISEGIENLKSGSTSEILPSSYGYHIVKVLEKIPPRELSLKQVRPEIKKILIQKNKERKLTAWKQDMFKQIKVERNYGLFDALSLREKNAFSPLQKSAVFWIHPFIYGLSPHSVRTLFLSWDYFTATLIYGRMDGAMLLS